MAGILESVPTIISTAVAAYGIVDAILELAENAKTIGTQMRIDALPFRTFGDLIETARYSIKFRLPQDDSAVISYMRDRQVLNMMEQEAFELSQDIDTQKEKIKKLQSNFGDHPNYTLRFYAAHRWKHIRKPKLDLLQPRMAQLKSTLQLIIAVIQLEVLSRNGSATRGQSRLDEIEELRQLIGKHIEAIGQIKQNSSIQTGGMTGDGGSATSVCFLAYTMARTGRVPRPEQGWPTGFDFTLLTQNPIMNIDPIRWAPPPDSLPATAPICPHCYRDTGSTERKKTTNGTTWDRNVSTRYTTNGNSRLTERALPPLPIEPPEQREPAPSRPQQNRAPFPPPESHTILPLFHPNPPLVEIREQPSGSEIQPPSASDDSSTDPEPENQYLTEPMYRPRSRSPRPRQPTTVEQVLVRHSNDAWVPLLVRFDPNLDIRNRHGVRGAEVPYGGLISEDYMDSLSLRDSVEWYRHEFVFPYDDQHRAVRGIGAIDIEWKKQLGSDDWDALVVEKPKVKCIVCREMPCEEDVVLKLHD